jgi:hypothetical protein
METETVTISAESAQLLLGILGQTTLAVGSEDFDELAPAILVAKRELTGALAAL